MMLTAKEVEALAKLQRTFPTAYSFTLETSSKTGIGANTYVKFTVEGVELTAEITDYSSW